MERKHFGQDFVNVTVWDHRLELSEINVNCKYSGPFGLTHQVLSKLSKNVLCFDDAACYIMNGTLYEAIVDILQATSKVPINLPSEFLDFYPFIILILIIKLYIPAIYCIYVVLTPIYCESTSSYT